MKQMLKYKKNRSEDIYNMQKGVTLVELVVVIFIIILISGIVLANYRSGGQRLALERATYKLTQALRQAQEMAMAPREGDCLGAPPPGFMGAYGIFLVNQDPGTNDEDYLTFFADCDSNGNYNAADEEIYRVEFGEGVTFVGSEPVETATGWPGQGRVVFYSSMPVGNFSPGDEKGIRIKLALDGLESIIQVNRAGLIYVE